MDKARLTVILEERDKNPALFKRDAHLYFEEAMPLIMMGLSHLDGVKKIAKKEEKVPPKKLTIHSPAKKIVPKKKKVLKKKKR